MQSSCVTASCLTHLGSKPHCLSKNPRSRGGEELRLRMPLVAWGLSTAEKILEKTNESLQDLGPRNSLWLEQPTQHTGRSLMQDPPPTHPDENPYKAVQRLQPMFNQFICSFKIMWNGEMQRKEMGIFFKKNRNLLHIWQLYDHFLKFSDAIIRTAIIFVGFFFQ